MEKSHLLKELRKEIILLDKGKLKEVVNFVKYLKNREELDPTLEILSNEDDYKSVQRGIQQQKEGDVFLWENVK